MKGFVDRFKNRFSRKKKEREVRIYDTGFVLLERGKPLPIVAWSHVLEVFAYKEDSLTFDDICLGFRVDADGTYWIVSEDFIGYHSFLKELNRRFEGIRADWFSEVAFPAFATNRTTLWGEPWKAETN